MLLELFLLIPFVAMTMAARPVWVRYNQAKKRGPEIPSMKPRPAIAPVDVDRQKAIEIGKRELEAPPQRLWEREYHQALVSLGEPMIETGEIYYNPRTGRERHLYYLEVCDCTRCNVTRRTVDRRRLER